MAIAAPTPYIEDHAFGDAGLDQDLREPGAKHDDDHGGGIGDASTLQNLRLDVVHADARQQGPDNGKQQQHDDRALPAHDRRHHDQERDQQQYSGQHCTLLLLF
jgi:hypothetical protein